MIKIRWEDSFLALLWTAILCAMITIMCFIFTHKKITGYYLESQQTTIGIAYHIKNDISWCSDTVVFTTNDIKIAFDRLETLNKMLTKEKCD